LRNHRDLKFQLNLNKVVIYTVAIVLTQLFGILTHELKVYYFDHFVITVWY